MTLKNFFVITTVFFIIFLLVPDVDLWGYNESGIEKNSPAEHTNILKMSLSMIAGLVLFLYGVTKLSDGFTALAGDRMKKILERFTVNRYAGVLTGAAATTIFDSSSVTIIMVIAMVNAGLLSFTQSLGVIMGSNIGTTVSSQIIAFNVNAYAPIAMGVGFVMYFFIKKKWIKNTGLVLLGLGMVFFGLDYMGDVMEPLQKSKKFIGLMIKLEDPLIGALVGAGFTAVIQSSSATLGIIITLASQGLITLPAGIAIMLGAEIGTCADTLLSTIGRSREAVRAGLFHLIFNIVTVMIGILFINQLTDLVIRVSGNANTSRQIANAHMLFNIAGVALFIAFVPWIAKGLIYLLPDKKDEATIETAATTT